MVCIIFRLCPNAFVRDHKKDQTSEETLATCYEIGKRQGKTCIVVNDMPGFYVNRILCPYLIEGLLMIEEGVRIEDIDGALTSLGMPIGPRSSR